MRQKFSKKLKDFLQIYAKSLKNTCISLMVALVLSFSFVGFLKDENPSFLMANVANLNNNEAINAHFPANIVLESSESDFVLRLGENLQKVDFIEGIIAFDPTKGLEISHSNAHFLTKLSDGIYRFSLPFEGKSLKKGTIIARFSKNSDIFVPISLTDTQFVSEGTRYNLSNIVE